MFEESRHGLILLIFFALLERSGLQEKLCR